MKDKWLSKSIKYLRHCTPKDKQLEDAIFTWLTDVTSHQAPINGEMLLLKAKMLG
ncbi:hypothetical protein DPMN_116353 [Dreissena polymorpha]|uniref:Uncharacterized protein n=1 Tax=Dreissena polymorpha TaxID=45954 RepID=A0A9D4QTG9_DREPO|nr:hypothetical protein DPMN_116353 [Dreissena polymorpha]